MLINKIIVYLALFVFVPLTILSQEAEKSAAVPHEPMYKILTRFPVNVSNKYVYKEHSKITRIFSNNNTLDFSRELTYHFSLRAPSPIDKSGFQLIEVSVDSMEYKFTNKDTTIIYNDQRDDLRPPKIDDFQIKFVPIGTDFQMTYSPYQEVAKVGGEMLLEKRKYVSDPKTAPSDELLKATWVNGLQDESLLNVFDVVKGFPPQHKVDIDSTWMKAIICEVEGSRFIDSVEFKLTNFNIQSFTIEGSSKALIPIPHLQRVFGLSQLIDFTNVTGENKYTIKMHPRGSVNQIDVDQNIELTYQVADDFIKQKVETKKSWFLEKMYNW
jgi:hypothetical protein